MSREMAAQAASVPDADAKLVVPGELRPLEFDVSFAADIHKDWSESANTGCDVPHWRCYTTLARVNRVRDLVAYAATKDTFGEGERDYKKSLDSAPKRGLLSWLREWARVLMPPRRPRR